MCKKKISVIVPVFNSESCLDQCLQSLVKQSYKNLEIILVDDGSTDNSPKICDKYEELFPNVKVLHKKNEGTSSARNAGIEIASGEYVGFVDSDDFVSLDMFELLSFYIDIDVICAGANVRFVDYEGCYSLKHDLWVSDNIRRLSGKSFLENLLTERLFGSVCNKIFKKEIFNYIKFQKGRLNEDYLFCYSLGKLLILKQKLYLEIPQYTYYYRYNPFGNSKGDRKEKCAKDALENSRYFLNDLKNYEDGYLGTIARNRYWSYLIGFVFDILIDKKNQIKYQEYLKEIKDIDICYVHRTFGIRHICGFVIIRFLPWFWRSLRIRMFCTKFGVVPPIAFNKRLEV